MGRRIRQWIGYLIMVVGLGLLAGPFLLGAREESAQARVVDSFYQSLEQSEAAVSSVPSEPAPTAEKVQETAETAREPIQPVQERMEVPRVEETAVGLQTAEESSAETAVELQTTEATQPPEETALEPQATEPQDAFYQAAKAYNASLLENGQDAMTRRSDVEHFALNALDYGYSENIVGTIRIPRLEIELGLFLGANSENMAKGAAIFGMTSVPLGQESENAAIAGHRGWRGTPMFREIQKLQINDPIYVTTPWRSLVYRVCEIRIVTPSDNSWCKLQEGRTLISLMTCHPYGQNYQRYVVFAELCPEEEKPSEEDIVKENLQTYDPTPREVILVHSDGTSETVAVAPASITPDKSEYGEAVPVYEESESTENETLPVTGEPEFIESSEVLSVSQETDGGEHGALVSNVLILAEDNMKPVAWIAAIVVALVGIWLTVMTILDFRNRKK